MVFFAILFVIGLGLGVTAAAFRILFDRPALGLYWDIPLVADSLSLSSFLPVRPVPLIIAVTVWGATGLFVSSTTSLPFSIAGAVSLAAGVISEAAACRILGVPHSDRGLVGASAVTENAIPADDWGLVRFRYAGGPVIMRALCVDGEAVQKGERVTLLLYRDGVFVVEPETGSDDKSPAQMEESGQGGGRAVIVQTESE